MTFLLLLAGIYISMTLSEAADCVCATAAVNIRSSAGVTSSNKLSVLMRGNCLEYKGRKANAGGYVWVNVDYNGRSAWIAENWLRQTTCSTSGGSGSGSGCPRIISRAEWGAKPSKEPFSKIKTTPKYWFVHHSAGAFCSTRDDCIRRVREIQKFHQETRGWNDIGYSFLVGEDGNVYEGRGWGNVGAHTRGYNSVGLASCIMGDFTNRLPNKAALDAVKSLIACAVSKGYIQGNYILRGHRDMGSTACPGDKLYAEIKTWPHYTTNEKIV